METLGSQLNTVGVQSRSRVIIMDSRDKPKRNTNHSRTIFLCGIRFRFTVNISVSVRVRLNVLLTRLTLGVLHAFVREW